MGELVQERHSDRESLALRQRRESRPQRRAASLERDPVRGPEVGIGKTRKVLVVAFRARASSRPPELVCDPEVDDLEEPRPQRTARRIVRVGVATLFGISILIFVMLRVVPGNIADILFDSAGMIDTAEKAKLEKELGLDQPIAVQYVQWIVGLAHGDLGYSYVSEKPALDEIAPRIPITAKLAGLALLFSIVFGVPLGVISAVKQNSRLDYVLRVISLSGLSMPAFWLGLLILMAFVKFFGTIPIYTNPPVGFWNALWLYSVPAAAVGFRRSALVMRLTRSSMLEVLRQDYIRTARAKGASDPNVNYHHALRNAVLPVVTVIGIEAAFLMGGLIVTETVFNIPGVARFLVEAIRWRDYPIVQNLVMFIAVVAVSINFLVDMLYAVLDPRIKYAG